MTETVERPKGWRGLHYRMYDWVLRWAAHPKAQTALFVMALAEASFFPIPPDVLLVAMSMAKAKRALRYALICSIGSVVGGAIGYGIGWGLWEGVSEFFYRFVPGFNSELYVKVSALYERWNFWIVFTAGFTPIPYKIFTIGAGVAKITFPIFLVASGVSRSARFFLVAGLIAWLGPRAESLIERYLGWITVALVVLLIGGFWILKQLL